MNQFLNNEINGDCFCELIIDLWYQSMNEFKEIEKNRRVKRDFSLTSESIKFTGNIVDLL